MISQPDPLLTGLGISLIITTALIGLIWLALKKFDKSRETRR